MLAIAAHALRRSTRSLFSFLSPMPAAHTVDTTERLAGLRDLMARGEHNVQAFVVPSEDQHSSEYLARSDKRRAFISGFSGSAGCAVVTLTDAYLFTDGRYFLQAEQQLDKNWTLMKQGLPGERNWSKVLAHVVQSIDIKMFPRGKTFYPRHNLDPSTRIGVDPTLISASDADIISTALKPRGSVLVSTEKNLVDAVWSERPPRPQNPVFHLDEKYAGQSPSEKIKALRQELAKKKHQALVVNMLDEIAWLFNLRGSDIDYNPVFFAYAVVTIDSVELFVNKAQLDETAFNYVGQFANIQPYEAFFEYLKQLPPHLKLDAKAKVLIGNKASLAIANALGKDNYVIAPSPVADLKSIKNATELEGFRQSHIRDGAALARYFAWLEEQLNDGVELNEYQGADKLEAFRSELELFRGLSFDTISGAGSNAAIIHYKPDPADCAIIKKDEIYLCDSGAQFLDGTTDVTRTWHFGTPTAEEKRAFTRVLQGHIAIDTAVFPSGTTVILLLGELSGKMVLTIGKPIKISAAPGASDIEIENSHGTGHGVGHFLNVHEGPHGIGVRIAYNSSPLKAGMTVSNEPGYYADGRFGIRIESIVLVREVKTPSNFGDKGYLGFENVTLCPIHKNLVDVDLLNAEEKKWLNKYHAETWEKVSPLLKNDERALKWLEKECAPL